MKIPKAKTKQAHTSQSKMGMGDYYGTGLTAKIGKTRDVTGFEVLSKKKLKTPPKSLA
jgi:hypothetical protein